MFRLSRTSVVILFIAFWTFPVAWPLYRAQEPPTEILNNIKARYGSLPGLTVKYDREIISQSMMMVSGKLKGDQASGWIHFKPPYFLKVEQLKPKAEMIISDSATLWWYIPDKKQAQRYPAAQLGKELNLLTEIFQGLKMAEEHFEINLSRIETEQDLFLMKLTPHPAWSDIDHIRLQVQKDGRIQVIEIMNYAGGMTRFTLGEIKVRKKFKKNFFIFEPPPGVEIITEGQ